MHPRILDLLAEHLDRLSKDGDPLVDEDQALGIEIELVVEPALALLQGLGPVPLDCVPGLFYA